MTTILTVRQHVPDRDPIDRAHIAVDDLVDLGAAYRQAHDAAMSCYRPGRWRRRQTIEIIETSDAFYGTSSRSRFYDVAGRLAGLSGWHHLFVPKLRRHPRSRGPNEKAPWDHA